MESSAANVAALTDPPRVERKEIEPLTPSQARALLGTITAVGSKRCSPWPWASGLAAICSGPQRKGGHGGSQVKTQVVKSDGTRLLDRLSRFQQSHTSFLA